MRTVDLIEKKSQGQPLSADEIRFLVEGFTEGEIPDYQMSAFLMAVLLKGMDDRETADLTQCMMESGEMVDLSDIEGIKADKHSTGGVGDTVTLIAAPLVAACGGIVAKMSGRGLGHTGGTVDKLASIPGTQVEITLDRFKSIVKKTGIAVIGQSEKLDPADKKIYALRDVTATVRSIPLIASSIMSKKLASGTDAIVLDIKVGSGAFMQSVEDAKKLAEVMVRIGHALGKRVTAVLTDMNQPLGMAIGNILEVKEAVEMLSGRIPETDPLYQVSMLIGEEMLMLSDRAGNREMAEKMLTEALRSGAGLGKLRDMITELGGNAAYLDPEAIKDLCTAKYTVPVYPRTEGYLFEMRTEMIGRAAQVLGAGREKKGDAIDPAVGIVIQKRLGDPVTLGEPIAVIYANDRDRASLSMNMIHEAVLISNTPPMQKPYVYEVIGDELRGNSI